MTSLSSTLTTTIPTTPATSPPSITSTSYTTSLNPVKGTLEYTQRLQLSGLLQVQPEQHCLQYDQPEQ
jgi:hypothetical protein